MLLLQMKMSKFINFAPIEMNVGFQFFSPKRSLSSCIYGFYYKREMDKTIVSNVRDWLNIMQISFGFREL